MASRAELVQICEEMRLNYDNLTIEEMKTLIRTKFDKKYNKPKYHISGDKFSEVLRRFLIEEYDYVLEDKEGNRLNYKLEKI